MACGWQGGLRVAQQGHDLGQCTLDAVLADERGQRLARADLDEGDVAQGLLGLHGLAEGDGRAHLRGPVGRVGGLLSAEGGSAHAGIGGQLRRRQLGARQGRLHAGQGALHRGAVEGVGHLQSRDGDASLFQRCGQRVDVGVQAGQHRELGSIERGHVDVGRQRLQGCQATSHGQHGAGRLHEHGFAALDHGANGVLRGHDTGEAGGGVFADAVADQRVRADGKTVEPGAHGVRHGEQRRLGQARFGQFGGCRFVGGGGLDQQATQRGGQLVGRSGQHLVESMLESRELCDQFARHAGVLRALAREGKDDAATALRGLALGNCAQRGDGFVAVLGHDALPLSHRLATAHQRGGHGGQRQIGVTL